MDLALDGYCGYAPMLDDAQMIRGFICRLAERIGMTIVNGPTVVSFKEHSGDSSAGLSAFAIIAESHIAVHTWPQLSFVRVDVGSCKDFDSEDAVVFIMEALRLTPTYRRVGERRLPAEITVEEVDVRLRGVVKWMDEQAFFVGRPNAKTKADSEGDGNPGLADTAGSDVQQQSGGSDGSDWDDDRRRHLSKGARSNIRRDVHSRTSEVP